MAPELQLDHLRVHDQVDRRPVRIGNRVLFPLPAIPPSIQSFHLLRQVSWRFFSSKLPCILRSIK